MVSVVVMEEEMVGSGATADDGAAADGGGVDTTADGILLTVPILDERTIC